MPFAFVFLYMSNLIDTWQDPTPETVKRVEAIFDLVQDWINMGGYMTEEEKEAFRKIDHVLAQHIPE